MANEQARPATPGGVVPAQSQGKVPTIIPLTAATAVDISFLPESERQVLLQEYMRGILNVGKKAQELNVDVSTLKNTLDALAKTTQDLSESGNSVTITHTQTSAIGRTEVIMGNTDNAKTGKLTKSQAGERDWTPYYVFAGLVALVVIAAVLGR